MNVRERSAYKKTQKKQHKINKMSTLTEPNNGLQKYYEGPDFFNVILNCLTLVLMKAIPFIKGVLQAGPQFGSNT